MKINKKSKTQVLFVFQNVSFLPKMKKYGQNGDEFYCLKTNFQNPKITGFPIYFAKFCEIRREIYFSIP